MRTPETLILRDISGQNWLVRIYHDEGIRQIYTTKTDEPGQDSIKIKTLSGYFKIKINNFGQIITYPIDSLG